VLRAMETGINVQNGTAWPSTRARMLGNCLQRINPLSYTLQCAPRSAQVCTERLTNCNGGPALASRAMRFAQLFATNFSCVSISGRTEVGPVSFDSVSLVPLA